jgi:hypothetical protein
LPLGVEYHLTRALARHAEVMCDLVELEGQPSERAPEQRLQQAAPRAAVRCAPPLGLMWPVMECTSNAGGEQAQNCNRHDHARDEHSNVDH